MIRAEHLNTRALTIRKAGDTPKWLLRKKTGENDGLEYVWKNMVGNSWPPPIEGPTDSAG
jgi:hypothetical protein